MLVVSPKTTSGGTLLNAVLCSSGGGGGGAFFGFAAFASTGTSVTRAPTTGGGGGALFSKTMTFLGGNAGGGFHAWINGGGAFHGRMPPDRPDMACEATQRCERTMNLSRDVTVNCLREEVRSLQVHMVFVFVCCFCHM